VDAISIRPFCGLKAERRSHPSEENEYREKQSLRRVHFLATYLDSRFAYGCVMNPPSTRSVLESRLTPVFIDVAVVERNLIQVAGWSKSKKASSTDV
jgi:hypothetical protein